MHFLSLCSQTLKNAKKAKTTADPQRKCILAKFKVYAMLTKHCVTSGFMHFFSFSQTLKKQKPLQIRSENAFFQIPAKR